MSKTSTPDTFVFCTGRVPDSIKINLLHSESVVKNENSNRILVIIDPDKAASSRDTMTIYIREGKDVQQNTFTFYYGTAPVVDLPPSPDSGSFAVKLDTLKWSFADNDNDSLKYNLYFGNNPDPELIASGLRDSRFVFDTSVSPGIYYWKVVADDGRFKTESPMWNIYVNAYVLKINTFGMGMTEDLFNVPVLVRLDGTEFPASLNSVVFRKEKNIKDTLPYEVDNWKIGADSGAAIWVLMDTVRANDSTQIIMQLGGDAGLVSDGHVVFDTANGFACVWHLQDSLGSTSDVLFLDATLNGINADDHTIGDRDGLIGYGQGFEARPDLIADNIRLRNVPRLDRYDKYMSCEAWIRPDAFIGEGIVFVLFGIDGPKFKLSMETGNIKVGTKPELLTMRELRSRKEISDGNWHHVACAINFSTGEFSIFIDGIKDTSEIKVINNIRSSPTPEAILGSDVNHLNYFLGHIDEFRIYHKEKSPDWIKFCYENQRPNSTVVKVIKP